MPIKPKRASVNSTIIFFDVVGYSKKDENTQFLIVNHMNDVVKKYFLNENRFNDDSKDFQTFSKIIDNDEIFIPGLFATGDGFLIVLDHNTTSPMLLKEYALVAINFSIHLINKAKEISYKVRIGINQGRLISYDNINGISFAGDALNDTQRIMDLGDAGHILFSKEIYNSLQLDTCKEHVMNFTKYEHVPVKNKELSIFKLNKSDKFDTDINDNTPSKIEHLQSGKSINEQTPIDVTGKNDFVYYIDNGKVSDDVFVFLSGIGLDHYDFEKIVFLMGKRAIAFTLPGLERYINKEFENNFKKLYSFDDYVNIAFHFTNKLFEEDLKDKRIHLVGFSMGADIFHKILTFERLPSNIKNAILLDANHGSKKEMFITEVLMDDKPEIKLMEKKTFNFKDDNRSLRYLYDVFSKEKVKPENIRELAKSYYKYVENTISNKEESFNSKNKLISQNGINVVFLFREGFTTSHIKNKPSEPFRINKKSFIEVGLEHKGDRTKDFNNSEFYYDKDDKTIKKFEHINCFSGYHELDKVVNYDNKIGHFDLIEYKFLIDFLHKYLEKINQTGSF